MRAGDVGEDEPDVPAALDGAGEKQAGDGARRVGRKLDHPVRHAGEQVAAAIGRGRMHVDHGLPAVELGHHRRKGRIAEPLVAIAREEPDAVGLQRIERVADLFETALDVGQRQAGEKTEAPAVIKRHPRAVLVALAVELEAQLGRDDGEAWRGD